MIDDVDFFRNFCVLYERESGLPQIRVIDLRNGQSKRIPFPGAGLRRLFLRESRLRHHRIPLRIPVADYAAVGLFLRHGKGNVDSAEAEEKSPADTIAKKYQVEQIYAVASDGVKIPVSVLHLKGAKLDGTGPLYLYGYGSYGISIDMFFNSNIFSMVDRGVVTAVAHIRGGGEMGKAWHDAGRMMNKKTTFTDFIACAEDLVKRGYGSKDRLVIEGRSAGGLLMGAVLNMRPDLFKAALVGVPFVDVINTMLDEISAADRG